MKAVALCVLAIGAFSGVRASDEGNNEGAEGAAVSELFNDAGRIDWNKYSPQALGMQLNYDEMTTDQLREVSEAFASLGLIAPEEIEDFMAALQDPRMRRMIKSVTEKWPETMERVMHDPKYRAFLEEFQGGFDEKALAKIVGLHGGLGGVAKALEDNSGSQ